MREYAGQTETGPAGEQPIRDAQSIALWNVNPGVTIAPVTKTQDRYCTDYSKDLKKPKTKSALTHVWAKSVSR
jgi:hypothetical protein